MKSKTAKTPLKLDCEASYEEQTKTAKGQTEYQALVRLVTQVLDAAGGGEDCSLRIGTTKARDVYSITLYQDNLASYATGLTWAGLLEQVANLL